MKRNKVHLNWRFIDGTPAHSSTKLITTRESGNVQLNLDLDTALSACFLSCPAFLSLNTPASRSVSYSLSYCIPRRVSKTEIIWSDCPIPQLFNWDRFSHVCAHKHKSRFDRACKCGLDSHPNPLLFKCGCQTLMRAH